MQSDTTSSAAGKTFASAIYQGTVRHRRFAPRSNNFSYKVFMVYLDLHEIDDVFAQNRFWSVGSFNLASFRREDYLDGNNQKSLYDAVADLVEARLGERPSGPIRMLSNLRYFGFIINPITTYYCFDKSGKVLETIVAEVTNTPWRNRIQYVLTVNESQQQSNKQQFLFAKDMHVSPFQPMELDYHWRGLTPGQNLLLHIDVNKGDETVLDATMVLEREDMSQHAMSAILRRFPVMTLKVFLAIYWQALKLFVKKIQYYPNPSNKILANNSTISNPMKSPGAK